MSLLEQSLISPDKSTEEALRLLEKSRARCAIVVDEQSRLLGTITDGDVRRGLLRGVALSAPCSDVMHKDPRTGDPDDAPTRLMALMTTHDLRQLPIVDADGVVRSLVLLDELADTRRKDNWVVLMAGGRGSRLAPLTNATPKPLLKVGRKPILETILESFIEHGFHKFFISINYKAAMIKEHFGDGSKWNVQIEYLSETEPLGTGGALSLLPGKAEAPVILMNGDILTNVNWHALLQFHKECQDKVTMCVRDVSFSVPFGVLEIDGHTITGLREKPSYQQYVNAGIYVIEPDVVAGVPKNEHIDITDVFEPLMGQNPGVSAFLINEYWMDIGRIDDFFKANEEFFDVFQ